MGKREEGLLFFFVFWQNPFFLMHWYFWRSVKDSFYNWLSRCSMKIGFFLSEVNIRNCSRRNNSSTQMHLVATENLLRLYRELSCTEKIKLRQERDGFCCSPSLYAHTFHMHTHHHCKGPCSSGLHKDCKTIVYSHFMPFFIICQYLCHIPIARCNGLQVVAATIGLPKRRELDFFILKEYFWAKLPSWKNGALLTPLPMKKKQYIHNSTPPPATSVNLQA